MGAVALRCACCSGGPAAGWTAAAASLLPNLLLLLAWLLLPLLWLGPASVPSPAVPVLACERGPHDTGSEQREVNHPLSLRFAAAGTPQQHEESANSHSGSMGAAAEAQGGARGS